MRQILCEVAHSAARTECQFKGFHKALMIRRGYKRAIIAVGHKILETVFVILSKKEAYKDPKVNYEELMVKRNAPRWIAMLRKYYIPEVA